MSEKALKTPTVLSCPDHRYRLATSRLNGCESILDIGGYEDIRERVWKLLGREVAYLPLNVDSHLSRQWYAGRKFEAYDGRNIPLNENSADAVISVDTLEHIPREERAALIREMVRVARDRVILVFPFKDGGGGARFDNAFVRLSQALRVAVKPTNLDHEEFGLPSVDDMLKWIQGENAMIEFGTNLKFVTFGTLFQLFINGMLPKHSVRLNERIRALMEYKSARENVLQMRKAYRAVITIDANKNS